MVDQARAEEHLQVIHALIHRASVYRAIAARASLFVGIMAIFAAGAVYINNEMTQLRGRLVRPREFATLWVVVLFLGVCAVGFFLWREAKRSGRPFFSPGM